MDVIVAFLMENWYRMDTLGVSMELSLVRIWFFQPWRKILIKFYLECCEGSIVEVVEGTTTSTKGENLALL